MAQPDRASSSVLGVFGATARDGVAIVGLIGTLFSALLFYGGYVIKRSTVPVAGKIVDFEIPKNPMDPADNGRHLMQYSVYNRGPAQVEGYSLKLVVDGTCDATKKTFSNGVIVQNVGACSHVCENDGTGVTIDVTLKNTGQALAPGAFFGVKLNAPHAKWEPVEVLLLGPGGVLRNVEAEIPLQPQATSWANDAMGFSPWVVLIVSLMTLLGYGYYRFVRVPQVVATKASDIERAYNEKLKKESERIGEEHERRSLEREQKAYMNAMLDSQAKSLVKDGKIDSDQFEALVRKALLKEPNGNNPQPPG